MLRITSLFIVQAILLTALFNTSVAVEVPDQQRVCCEKPFDNTINLKHTWIKIEGSTFFVSEADIFTVWKKRIGFGIDTAIGSGNFYDVRPYATFSYGRVPLTWIVGFDAVGNGGRYVEYGVFYPQKIGKMNAVAGIVNFNAVSSEARDYLDGLVSVTTPLGMNYSAGVDLEVTHRWNGKADTLFAGPVLNSKIGTSVLRTRFQIERHWSPGSRIDGYIAFISLRIPFNAL
jgi:hypothetical protein